MGLIDRIKTLVKANLNDLISRAEDPEKILNQALQDMHQNLYEARIEVTKTAAEEKKLEREYRTNKALAEEWEKKAELAVKKGDESLAREALRRKRGYDNLAESFKEQWEEQKKIVASLKVQLAALDAKIDEAERKRRVLIARQKRAAAQKVIHEAMAEVADTTAFEAMDRMEAKVSDIEARAEAAAEISVDELEDEFEKMEEDSEIENELKKLKAKVEDEAASEG